MRPTGSFLASSIWLAVTGRSSCNFIAAAALVIKSGFAASKHAARGFPCSSVPNRTVMFPSPSRFLESEVWRVISALHKDKGGPMGPLGGCRGQYLTDGIRRWFYLVHFQ